MSEVIQDDTRLRHGLAALSLAVSDETIARMIQFLSLLRRWNAAYNLTRITDWDDMITLHVLDSLAVLPWVRGTRILDVGTGAGFPGVPWALLHPEWSVTLLDSNGKKIRFLNQVIRELGLRQVNTVQTRIEGYAGTADFDTVVTRAVGSVADSWVHIAPLLGVGGCFLGMKGQNPEAECRLLTAAQWQIESVSVPGLSAKRHVVVIQAAA